MRPLLRLFIGSMIALSPGIALGAPFAYIGNIGEAKVSVIDAATNSVVATVPLPDSVTGIAVNPAGTRVYAANSLHTYVIDTATNAVVATVTVGTGIGGYAGVAVHPAGTRVYVTSNWGQSAVKVIDTVTNTVVADLAAYYDTPVGIAVNAAGTKFYVANMFSGSVSVYDTASNRMIAIVDLTVDSPCGRSPIPFGLAVNPSGTRVYVANQNCMGPDGYWYTSVIETDTYTVIAHVASGTSPSPRGVAVSPDGSRVYVSNGAVIDTATLKMIATFPGSSLNGIALSPDGTRAYVPILSYGSPGDVLVVDTTTDAVVATVNVGGTPFAFGQFVVPAPVPFAISTVIEYHHAAFDHYFITPVAAEIALLDARGPPFEDWSRTGYSFNVYSPVAAAAGSVAICRFFNDHYWPKSSHFYAPQGFGCEADDRSVPRLAAGGRQALQCDAAGRRERRLPNRDHSGLSPLQRWHGRGAEPSLRHQPHRAANHARPGLGGRRCRHRRGDVRAAVGWQAVEIHEMPRQPVSFRAGARRNTFPMS